jgi:hypothetical protein
MGYLLRVIWPTAGINVPIWRRTWIRFQGASMGAYLLNVPIDATDENGFKDKQDAYIFSCRWPKITGVQLRIDGSTIPSLIRHNGLGKK